MKAELTRNIPLFSGDLKAGATFDVLSVTLFSNGRGISGVPVDAIRFIYPDDKAVNTHIGTESKAAPWSGPDATVKVPDFVPALKAEVVKPPIAATAPRSKVKPAQGQKSMFDMIDEI